MSERTNARNIDRITSALKAYDEMAETLANRSALQHAMRALEALMEERDALRDALEGVPKMLEYAGRSMTGKPSDDNPPVGRGAEYIAKATTIRAVLGEGEAH